jgi:hypothetical protein
MKRFRFQLLSLAAIAGCIHSTSLVTPAAAGPNDPLDLGAMVQPVPLDARFSQPGYLVWCGAPVRGNDGRYHLFYSRWPVEKGFHPGWAIYSEIAYAVSDKPLGPYQFVNVALPARGTNAATGQEFWDADVTHNPNIVLRDGKYLLYYVGNHGDGNYPTHRNHQRIGVAIADKPEGPWRRFDQPIIDVSTDATGFDSLCVANPAAAVRPDGGLIVIYKAVAIVPGKVMGGNVRYGVAVADKPEGPYVKQPGRVFEAEGAEAKKHWMLAEDPYIWFSRNYGHRYYAVARDVVGKFTGASGGLALFESGDGLHWHAAAQPKVLGVRFTWADGTMSHQNVERPALLLDGEEPVALFGATDGYQKNGRIAFNVQIPLKAQAATVATNSDDILLFTYFRHNGRDGVHLAMSTNGVDFFALNNDQPIFKPPQWPGQNLTRDASILYHGGKFRMVWTSEWKGRVFGYSESSNLVHWSEPRPVKPFPDSLPAEDQPDNIWAPEIHFDPLKQDYFILFASTTPRERNDADDSNNNGKRGSQYDNRVHITRTKDFQTWSAARVFFDRDFASIDAVMRRDEANQRWVMVIKCSRDETLAKMPGRNLWLTFAGLDLDKLDFSPLEGPIAGNHSPLFSDPAPRKAMAEGPSLLWLRDHWLLAWDEPAGGGVQLATSPDLKTWTHLKSAKFPHPAQHGTLFLAPRSVVGWLKSKPQ